MKLTVYCIAKNEETALPLMIESVRGIADRIVVCDTGSTDRTRELADVLADEVLVHPKSTEWS